MKINFALFLLLFISILVSCNVDKKVLFEPQVEQEVVIPTLNLDLDKPIDNLTAFVKVRGSLDSLEEVIYYANGAIYGVVDGEWDKHLMDYEMYSIGRIVEVETNKYHLLTREVLLYMDKETGEVLEHFDNPYTEEKVKVLHVWNDPVNQTFQLEGKYGKWGIDHNKYGKDMICMNADILLAYPSKLTVEDYPKNSQSDLYEAGELFQFFVSEKELNDPSLQSTNATISWTRIGPWLPWMNMGQKPGRMLYQGAGYKISEKNYDELPAVLREYVLANNPVFRNAPKEYSSPNETSWTYFKKMNPK